MTGDLPQAYWSEEEFFCGLNGSSPVEGVCICVPYDIVAVAQSTPSD